MAMLLLVKGSEMPGQSHSAQTQVGITSTRSFRTVEVDVMLTAHDEQLIVPYCGEEEGGLRVLCALGTQLQARVGKHWHPVGFRDAGAEGGGVPLKTARASVVAPGTAAHYLFRCNMDFLALESGQPLRLIVNTWPNEGSMRSGETPKELASPQFRCPRSGER